MEKQKQEQKQIKSSIRCSGIYKKREKKKEEQDGDRAKPQKEAVQHRASGRCAAHTAEVLLRLPSAQQPCTQPASPAAGPRSLEEHHAACRWFLPLEHLHLFEIRRRNQGLEGYTRTSSAPRPPPEQDAVSESAADSAWREERRREDWAWEELAPKGEKWRRKKKTDLHEKDTATREIPV